MADWLMFLLAIRRDNPRWQAAQSVFWAAYGEPEKTRANRFREEVHNALHVSRMVALGVHSQQAHFIERGHIEIHEMAQTIPALVAKAINILNTVGLSYASHGRQVRILRETLSAYFVCLYAILLVFMLTKLGKIGIMCYIIEESLSCARS